VYNEVTYWTSTQGTTKCVYFPVNKDGEPSLNCWHQKLGLVYHLYAGGVESESMNDNASRARDLESQFNAEPGEAWSFAQSAEFSTPDTGDIEFSCTLEDLRGMVCEDLNTNHGFQMNGSDPQSW